MCVILYLLKSENRHFWEVKTLWLVLTTAKGRLRVKKDLGLRFEFYVGSGQGKGVVGLNVKGWGMH